MIGLSSIFSIIRAETNAVGNIGSVDVVGKFAGAGVIAVTCNSNGVNTVIVRIRINGRSYLISEVVAVTLKASLKSPPI